MNEGVPRQNQKRKIMLGRRATGYLPVGASHWRKRHPPHASRKIISSYFPFLKTTFLQKQSPFYSVSKSLFQKISFLPIQKTGRGIVTFSVPDEKRFVASCHSLPRAKNGLRHRDIRRPRRKTGRQPFLQTPLFHSSSPSASSAGSLTKAQGAVVEAQQPLVELAADR